MKSVLKIHTLAACTYLLVLAGCDGAAGGSNTTDAANSPQSKLEEIVRAYLENSVSARRTYGGQHVVVGGPVYSVGRNADGSIGIIIGGAATGGVGLASLSRKFANYAAKLKTGDEIKLNCVVDPAYEGMAAEFVRCKPAATGA